MIDHLRNSLSARIAGTGERGASAVEYGLLIAGIAALIAVVVFSFGGAVGGLFGGTCQEMISAGGSHNC